VRAVAFVSPKGGAGKTTAALLLALGLAAYYLYPPLQGRGVSLLVWGTVFYLILLAAESYVVSRQVAGSNASR